MSKRPEVEPLNESVFPPFKVAAPMPKSTAAPPQAAAEPQQSTTQTSAAGKSPPSRR